MVIFQSHECGICIAFRKTISIAKFIKAVFIVRFFGLYIRLESHNSFVVASFVCHSHAQK